MTKITFIFDNPEDTNSFEESFAGITDLFKGLPNTVKTEFSKVHPKEDGSATPAHRMVDIYFETYDDACNAVKTAEAQKLFPDVFKISSGNVKVLFCEIK